MEEGGRRDVKNVCWGRDCGKVVFSLRNTGWDDKRSAGMGREETWREATRREGMGGEGMY